MMLSIFKTKAGAIISKEVELMAKAKEVRKQLNLANEINPLYFFEYVDFRHNFTQLDADGRTSKMRDKYIVDSIPDDIKIEALKWMNPNLRGTFLICLYVNSDESLSDEASLIGYLQAPKKFGASGNLFYKKFSGSFESVLLQMYGNDISIPEIIKSNWNGIKRIELSLYSVNVDKTIPFEFEGGYEKIIKINKNGLTRNFGLKL